jgi:predicted nucleotidyltransferase
MKSTDDIKEIIYNKNPMFILSYLTKHKSDQFIYGSKIAEDLKISQSGTSLILRQFENIGIISSRNIGKTVIYDVNRDNQLINSFRAFENLLELSGLIEDIKLDCRKVILFGSCAKGRDSVESDIDLFILADDDNKDRIRERISDYKIDRVINPVIVNPLELVEMENSDKVFLNEINSGIELWGGSNG